MLTSHIQDLPYDKGSFALMGGGQRKMVNNLQAIFEMILLKESFCILVQTSPDHKHPWDRLCSMKNKDVLVGS